MWIPWLQCGLSSAVVVGEILFQRLPPLRTRSDVDTLVLDHLVISNRRYQLGDGDESVAAMQRKLSEHIGMNYIPNLITSEID